MKAKELRDQSLNELEAMYKETQKELYKLSNEAQRLKKVEKPHLIKKNKKQIARLLTVMTEKQTA